MTTQSRQPLVAGNWKMNGNLTLAESLADGIEQAELQVTEVVVCPPFPYLAALSKRTLTLGAQDVSACESGAYTGDVSAAMLNEMGCRYVIVGHSERRDGHQESNALVGEKAAQALSQGLTPIVCVGESEQTRQAGLVESHIAEQLKAIVDSIGGEAIAKIVIAYEPIWAIGTGQTATPEQAQAVHRFIRGYLAEVDPAAAAKIRILYGGSVKGSNAAELFAQPDVDGGLIGGASLKVDEFLTICQAANA
ncbi:Triose-phosphate isomerase [Saliniradius amylolyticus]|uniref:Triosephosphate isomerase n=1 Tax=Saliniradius amylolyticus TaxID=2183582 RepID=A0A2S2E1X8_9ALTE|nr:triose-phosphate isomerase [Saliniradius amylolyticus]AWL11522.1 Triose-phosphate isomerase [Saliniradius amylolyticus]